MLKNSMKSFVMSMKRMCYMVGTRRRLKRYGVMSPHVSVTEYVFLCSVAEFVSWDSKKRG